MEIRKADMKDSEGIKKLHLQAFDESEADMVSNLAVALLNEKSTIEVISLVATNDDLVVGHVAFSPVFLDSSGEHFGYILAPLAVLPDHQGSRVGSSIVNHGIDDISASGGFVVFVYGDPKYYSRFGFSTEFAQSFPPAYTLQYPEGWLAMNVNSAELPEAGKIKCVNSLNDPELW